MTALPTHLESFNRERELRIQAHNRAADVRDRSEASGVLVQARLEATRIIREARVLAYQIKSEAIQEAKERVREADIEAKRIVREANDLLAKGERAKRQGEKSLETARNRARLIREEGHDEKRKILVSARACTKDVESLYEAADADCKRMVASMKSKTYRECQALRIQAEREVKLIREKARNEGLALADVELERRALRDLGLSSVGGRS